MNNIFRVGIGLDIGEKRIGLARGDLEVRMASPLLPLIRETFPDKKTLFSALAKIIRENGATFLVAGLPRNSRGEETRQSDFSRKFVNDFREFLPADFEIYFQDESLTSVKAEENLRARKNFCEEMLRDGTLDSEAAAIILADFLESSARDSAISREKTAEKLRENPENFGENGAEK